MSNKIRDIIRMGHPTLAQVAKKVSVPSQQAADIIDSLKQTLIANGGGLGLAAPQINVSKRILIYTIPNERNDEDVDIHLTALINPEIIARKGAITHQWEGCFSLPGLMGLVPRFHEINYQFQTIEGEIMTKSATGFHARVLQHEIDHLDGILYIERMDDMRQLGYVEEVQQAKM
jgi:peptide deformylase